MPTTQATICIEMEDRITLPSKKMLEDFKKQAGLTGKSLASSLATPLDRFSGAIGDFTSSVALFDLSMQKMVKSIQKPKKEMMTFMKA